jgi:hypothetical protein
MVGPSIQSESVLVSVLGGFNPRIVEPLWLAKHGLVAEEEADDAQRQLIDEDLARIVLPWAELIVLQDRLQVDARNEIVNAAQLRDLLVGVLRLLPHTPITIVSINHRVLVSAESEEQWHGVGHTLAPKELWEGILDKPGMLDYAMQGIRPDGLDGAIKVRIQPSPHAKWGIFINVNDEWVLPDQDDPEPAARAAELIQKIWPEAEARTTAIRRELYKRVFI